MSINSASVGFKRWISPSVVFKGDVEYYIRNAEEDNISERDRDIRNNYYGVSFYILKHIHTIKKNSVYLVGGLGYWYTKDTVNPENVTHSKTQQKAFGITSQFGFGFECFLMDNISFSAEVFAYAGYEKRTESSPEHIDIRYDIPPGLPVPVHDGEDVTTALSIRNGTSSLMLSIYF